MKFVLTSTVCASCLVFAASTASAQTQPAPERGTVGQWLNAEFADLRASCRLPETRVVNRRAQPINYIPSAISQTFQEHNNSPITVDQSSLTRYFSRVYFWDSSASRWMIVAAPLPLDFSNLADRLTESGLGSVRYTHNCITTVQAAADLAGGVSFPPAAFEAAIKASTSSNGALATSFVYGVFQSPLAVSLGRRTNRTSVPVAVATEDIVALWRWYSEAGREQIGRNLFIRTDVHGISRYRFRDVSNLDEATASGAGRANFLVFNSNVDTDAALRLETTVRLQDFEIISWRTAATPAANSVALMTVGEAAQFLRDNIRLSFVGGGRNNVDVYDNQPQTLTYEMPRSGRELCGRTWKSSSPNIVLSDKQPVSLPDGSVTCRFTAAVNVQALKDAGQQSVDFEVLTEFQSTTGTPEDRQLVLNVSSVPINDYRDRPSTNVISARVARFDPQSRNLEIEAEWIVLQTSQLRFDQFSPRSSYLDCNGTRIDLSTSGAPQLQPIQGAGTVNETRRLQIKFVGQVNTSLVGTLECTLASVGVANLARNDGSFGGTREAFDLRQQGLQLRLPDGELAGQRNVTPGTSVTPGTPAT